MELVTRATHGRPVEHQPRKADLPPVYPKGRTCSTRGCSTVLSQYNAGPQCNACDPSRRFQVVGTAEELDGLMRDAA
jgi:hypothetical protein